MDGWWSPLKVGRGDDGGEEAVGILQWNAEGCLRRTAAGVWLLDALEVAGALPVGYGVAIGTCLGCEEVGVVSDHVFSER